VDIIRYSTDKTMMIIMIDILALIANILIPFRLFQTIRSRFLIDSCVSDIWY